MTTSLQCFLDADRACGPDCMAHMLQVPEGDDYKGEQQWAHCSVLVSAHRLGKHAVIIASIAAGALKQWGTLSADRKRTMQPQPPKVIG